MFPQQGEGFNPGFDPNQQGNASTNNYQPTFNGAAVPYSMTQQGMERPGASYYNEQQMNMFQGAGSAVEERLGQHGAWAEQGGEGVRNQPFFEEQQRFGGRMGHQNRLQNQGTGAEFNNQAMGNADDFMYQQPFGQHAYLPNQEHMPHMGTSNGNMGMQYPGQNQFEQMQMHHHLMTQQGNYHEQQFAAHQFPGTQQGYEHNTQMTPQMDGQRRSQREMDMTRQPAARTHQANPTVPNHQFQYDRNLETDTDHNLRPGEMGMQKQSSFSTQRPLPSMEDSFPTRQQPPPVPHELPQSSNHQALPPTAQFPLITHNEGTPPMPQHNKMSTTQQLTPPPLQHFPPTSSTPEQPVLTSPQNPSSSTQHQPIPQQHPPVPPLRQEPPFLHHDPSPSTQQLPPWSAMSQQLPPAPSQVQQPQLTQQQLEEKRLAHERMMHEHQQKIQAEKLAHERMMHEQQQKIQAEKLAHERMMHEQQQKIQAEKHAAKLKREQKKLERQQAENKRLLEKQQAEQLQQQQQQQQQEHRSRPDGQDQNQLRQILQRPKMVPPPGLQNPNFPHMQHNPFDDQKFPPINLPNQPMAQFGLRQAPNGEQHLPANMHPRPPTQDEIAHYQRMHHNRMIFEHQQRHKSEIGVRGAPPVPGAVPGVMPGAMPGFMPGAMPGVMHGHMPPPGFFPMGQMGMNARNRMNMMGTQSPVFMASNMETEFPLFEPEATKKKRSRKQQSDGTKKQRAPRRSHEEVERDKAEKERAKEEKRKEKEKKMKNEKMIVEVNDEMNHANQMDQIRQMNQNPSVQPGDVHLNYPYHEFHPQPSSETYLQFGQTSGTMSEINAGAIPSTMQEVMLEINAGAIPSTMQEVMSETNAGAIPNTMQEVMSETNAGAIPNTMQEVMSETNAGAIPNTMQEVMSETNAGAIPSTMQEVMSETNAGAIPSTMQEVMSETNAGAIPSTTQEVMSEPMQEAVSKDDAGIKLGDNAGVMPSAVVSQELRQTPLASDQKCTDEELDEWYTGLVPSSSEISPVVEALAKELSDEIASNTRSSPSLPSPCTYTSLDLSAGNTDSQRTTPSLKGRPTSAGTVNSKPSLSPEDRNRRLSVVDEDGVVFRNGEPAQNESSTFYQKSTGSERTNGEEIGGNNEVHKYSSDFSESKTKAATHESSAECNATDGVLLKDFLPSDNGFLTPALTNTYDVSPNAVETTGTYNDHVFPATVKQSVDTLIRNTTFNCMDQDSEQHHQFSKQNAFHPGPSVHNEKREKVEGAYVNCFTAGSAEEDWMRSPSQSAVNECDQSTLAPRTHESQEKPSMAPESLQQEVNVSFAAKFAESAAEPMEFVTSELVGSPVKKVQDNFDVPSVAAPAAATFPTNFMRNNLMQFNMDGIRTPPMDFLFEETSQFGVKPIEPDQPFADNMNSVKAVDEAGQIFNPDVFRGDELDAYLHNYPEMTDIWNIQPFQPVEQNNATSNMDMDDIEFDPEALAASCFNKNPADVFGTPEVRKEIPLIVLDDDDDSLEGEEETKSEDIHIEQFADKIKFLESPNAKQEDGDVSNEESDESTEKDDEIMLIEDDKLETSPSPAPLGQLEQDKCAEDQSDDDESNDSEKSEYTESIYSEEYAEAPTSATAFDEAESEQNTVDEFDADLPEECQEPLEAEASPIEEPELDALSPPAMINESEMGDEDDMEHVADDRQLETPGSPISVLPTGPEQQDDQSDEDLDEENDPAPWELNTLATEELQEKDVITQVSVDQTEAAVNQSNADLVEEQPIEEPQLGAPYQPKTLESPVHPTEPEQCDDGSEMDIAEDQDLEELNDLSTEEPQEKDVITQVSVDQTEAAVNQLNADLVEEQPIEEPQLEAPYQPKTVESQVHSTEPEQRDDGSEMDIDEDEDLEELNASSTEDTQQELPPTPVSIDHTEVEHAADHSIERDAEEYKPKSVESPVAINQSKTEHSVAELHRKVSLDEIPMPRQKPLFDVPVISPIKLEPKRFDLHRRGDSMDREPKTLVPEKTIVLPPEFKSSVPPPNYIPPRAVPVHNQSNVQYENPAFNFAPEGHYNQQPYYKQRRSRFDVAGPLTEHALPPDFLGMKASSWVRPPLAKPHDYQRQASYADPHLPEEPRNYARSRSVEQEVARNTNPPQMGMPVRKRPPLLPTPPYPPIPQKRFKPTPQYKSTPPPQPVPQYKSTPPLQPVPQYQSTPPPQPVPQYKSTPSYQPTTQYQSTPPTPQHPHPTHYKPNHQRFNRGNRRGNSFGHRHHYGSREDNSRHENYSRRGRREWNFDNTPDRRNFSNRAAKYQSQDHFVSNKWENYEAQQDRDSGNYSYQDREPEMHFRHRREFRNYNQQAQGPVDFYEQDQEPVNNFRHARSSRHVEHQSDRNLTSVNDRYAYEDTHNHTRRFAESEYQPDKPRAPSPESELEEGELPDEDDEVVTAVVQNEEHEDMDIDTEDQEAEPIEVPVEVQEPATPPVNNLQVVPYVPNPFNSRNFVPEAKLGKVNSGSSSAFERILANYVVSNFARLTSPLKTMLRSPLSSLVPGASVIHRSFEVAVWIAQRNAAALAIDVPWKSDWLLRRDRNEQNVKKKVTPRAIEYIKPVELMKVDLRVEPLQEAVTSDEPTATVEEVEQPSVHPVVIPEPVQLQEELSDQSTVDSEEMQSIPSDELSMDLERAQDTLIHASQAVIDTPPAEEEKELTPDLQTVAETVSTESERNILPVHQASVDTAPVVGEEDITSSEQPVDGHATMRTDEEHAEATEEIAVPIKKKKSRRTDAEMLQATASEVLPNSERAAAVKCKADTRALVYSITTETEGHSKAGRRSKVNADGSTPVKRGRGRKRIYKEAEAVNSTEIATLIENGSEAEPEVVVSKPPEKRRRKNKPEDKTTFGEAAEGLETSEPSVKVKKPRAPRRKRADGEPTRRRKRTSNEDSIAVSEAAPNPESAFETPVLDDQLSEEPGSLNADGNAETAQPEISNDADASSGSGSKPKKSRQSSSRKRRAAGPGRGRKKILSAATTPAIANDASPKSPEPASLDSSVSASAPNSVPSGDQPKKRRKRRNAEKDSSEETLDNASPKSKGPKQIQTVGDAVIYRRLKVIFELVLKMNEEPEVSPTQTSTLSLTRTGNLLQTGVGKGKYIRLGRHKEYTPDELTEIAKMMVASLRAKTLTVQEILDVLEAHKDVEIKEIPEVPEVLDVPEGEVTLAAQMVAEIPVMDSAPIPPVTPLMSPAVE